LNGTVGFMLDPKLLIRRRKKWQEVVLTRLLQFCANARDFFAVRIGRVRFVENVVLLTFHKHAPVAILEIFTEDAKFTVTAELRVEAKITSIAIRAVDTLVRPLALKTMREIAAVFVTIGLDAEEAIFECKRIVTAVAVLTFCEVIAHTVF
jgi:hypothetical protein